MKEITFKFETEEDYNIFIKEVILPEIVEPSKEWIPETNTLIIKDLSKIS